MYSGVAASVQHKESSHLERTTDLKRLLLSIFWPFHGDVCVTAEADEAAIENIFTLGSLLTLTVAFLTAVFGAE